MPNWVKCRLSMRDIESLHLFTADENGNKHFDFNTLIKMPEELNITSGGYEDMAIKAYMTKHGNPALQKMMNASSRWNIIVGDYKVEDEKLEEYAKSHSITVDELVKLGERYCLNVFYHGARTWYDWCVNNWGTKWNACETEIIDSDTIEFSTAWSAPLPIIIELSKRHPGRVAMIEWADEDMGSNVGQIAFKGGFIAEDETGCVICNNRPDNQSNEAYEIYVKLWGETKCLAKDENGCYYYRGCEGCDGCD